MSDAEILEARRTVVAFLQQPGLRKAKGVLARPGGARCCLGHMCVALGLEVVKGVDMRLFFGGRDTVLPDSVKNRLGMYHETGEAVRGEKPIKIPSRRACSSLAELNDETGARPHEIGAYLESVIMGGPNTPWREISP